MTLRKTSASPVPRPAQYLANLYLDKSLFSSLCKNETQMLGKRKKNNYKHYRWSEEALSSLQINVSPSPLVKDTEPSLFLAVRYFHWCPQSPWLCCLQQSWATTLPSLSCFGFDFLMQSRRAMLCIFACTPEYWVEVMEADVSAIKICMPVFSWYQISSDPVVIIACFYWYYLFILYAVWLKIPPGQRLIGKCQYFGS